MAKAVWYIQRAVKQFNGRESEMATFNQSQKRRFLRRSLIIG
jgi:hypothetical protein